MATGATHILAVSGLHVGIIALLLGFLLRFFHRYAWGRYVAAALTIIGIWFYALLTGLSPSVLRAATMFSLFIIGQRLHRNASVYNILAAAALILLLFNPYHLYQLGFLLSFTAVLSILLLYPFFNGLFSFENAFLKKTWEASAVSLAAQVGTFPICLYFFHQFPLYFLLANLFAVYFAFLIVALFFLLLGSWGLESCLKMAFLYDSHSLQDVFGYLLYYAIYILNNLLDSVAALPNAVMTDLYLSPFQLLACYLFLLFIFSFFHLKKALFFKYILHLLIVVVFTFFYGNFLQSEQKAWHFFHDKKNNFTSFVIGSKAFTIYSYSDSLTAQKSIKKIAQYQESSALESHFILVEKNATQNGKVGNYLSISPPLIHFMDESILLLDTPIEDFSSLPPKVNYLILSQNAPISLSLLSSKIAFDKVIFAANNYRKNVATWKGDCQALAIPFYDVKERGAFKQIIH